VNASCPTIVRLEWGNSVTLGSLSGLNWGGAEAFKRGDRKLTDNAAIVISAADNHPFSLPKTLRDVYETRHAGWDLRQGVYR